MGPGLPAQNSTLTNEVELTPALVIVITYCYVTTEHRWSVFLLLQGLCWSPFLLLILLYGNDGHSSCVVPHSASQEPSFLFRKSINIGKCGFSCKKIGRKKVSQGESIIYSLPNCQVSSWKVYCCPNKILLITKTIWYVNSYPTISPLPVPVLFHLLSSPTMLPHDFLCT